MKSGLKYLLLAFLTLSIVTTTAAQDSSISANTDSQSAASFRQLVLAPGANTLEDSYVNEGKRSIPLALGLSAVVPGAGQAYNRQWVKAGILVAAEVAMLTGYFVWHGRGQDGEDAFRATAHADWSPAQYATWLNDYSDFLEQNHGVNVTAPKVDVPQGIDFARPEAWDSATESAVRAFFNEIRALEGQMIHPETGASFSHRLPYFGEQQYYELIGKYFQFAPGWFDYAAWIDGQGFTDAIDPERSNTNGEKVHVTDSFFEYADNHAHSQTLLRRASRITGVLFVNHILAAADAAVFSKLHNDRISTSMSLRVVEDGQLQPQAHIAIRF